MKKYTELKKEIDAIVEVQDKLIDTKKLPPSQVIETYQRIYDMFDFLLEQHISALEILSNQTPSFKRKLVAVQAYPVLGAPAYNDNEHGLSKQLLEKMKTGVKEIKDSLSSSVVIGGGALSEQFIDGYNQPFKDIDFFINSSLMNDFLPFSPVARDHSQILQELTLLLQSFGFHPANQTTEPKPLFVDETDDGSYLEKRDIEAVFTGKVNGISVDLVFIQSMSLDFDLAFREFFYNGSTILCSEAALRDVNEKKISVRSLTTPFSTYYRLLEFGRRYSFTVDSFSEKFLLKTIQFFSEKENTSIVDSFQKIKKYSSAKEPSLLEKEVLALELTPFEKKILEGIENQRDKFYLLSERLKNLLQQEKQGLNFNFSTEVQLPKTNFGDYKPYSDSSSEQKNALCTSFMEKRKEYQFKALFSSDTEKIKDKMFADLMEESKFFDDGFPVNSVYHNNSFARFLNFLVLERSLEKNPLYSKDTFVKEHSFFLNPEDAELLFLSATSTAITVQTNLLHLLLGADGPCIEAKFAPEQVKPTKVFFYQTFNSTDPLETFYVSFENDFLTKEREEKLKNTLKLDFRPAKNKFTGPVSFVSSNVKSSTLSHSVHEAYLASLENATRSIEKLRTDVALLAQASASIDDGLPF